MGPDAVAEPPAGPPDAEGEDEADLPVMSYVCPLDDEYLPLDAGRLKSRQVGAFSSFLGTSFRVSTGSLGLQGWLVGFLGNVWGRAVGLKGLRGMSGPAWVARRV